MAGTQYTGTGRIGTIQNVAYTGTFGQVTNKIGTETYRVRIMCTTDAFVSTDGSTPSSTGTSVYLPAFQVEYFTTTPGQKPSAVQVSAAGTMYVTEIW